MKFRRLRADEIEVRVNQINEKGCTLLLYKDARCDMNLLDEVVGPENWQCRYEEHKGTLFCYVGIRIDGEWIWKSDAGAPSNMESQKGEASDAFKRACVRWQIGRDLYNSPFIWIPAGKYAAEEYAPKKWRTYDRFKVISIGYDDAGNITQLSIMNTKTKKSVFEYGAKAEELPDWAEKIKDKEWTKLKMICSDAKVDVEDLLNRYGYSIEKPSEISVRDYYDMIKRIEEGKA